MSDRKEYQIIKKSGLFDAHYYLRQYPDVRRADVDPLLHYIKFGWKEGRNPNPHFNTRSYLAANPDLVNLSINPLIHFIQKSKRGSEVKPSFTNIEVSSSERGAHTTIKETRTDAKTAAQKKSNQGNIQFKYRIKSAFGYFRVNGLSKTIKRIINKAITYYKVNHPAPNESDVLGNNNPYRIVYKRSFRESTGENQDDYVDYTEHNVSTINADVKLIAFYLPQYHPIPENDEWWGKGFTEWTNVSKALPQFVGHYQPRLPGELGFYDLRVPQVLRRQVELAKNYGIYGFCFYYYWFKGKKLLEMPLERFLADTDIDFPFCICWANENWTRRWDGQESDILIAQDHTPETDIDFIHELIPLFKHKNYIHINGRPVIIIYRVDLLPEPEQTVKRWVEECRKAEIKEPYTIAAQVFGFRDPRKVGFDAAVEFPPHLEGIENITDQIVILNEKYAGNVYNYGGKASLSELYLKTNHQEYKVFKTVSPGWDNEPRKPGRGHTFINSSPESYKTWLKGACEIAKGNPLPEERIVFINAWNEWGEGAYLEPDRRFGYAYLQATYESCQQSFSFDKPAHLNWTILFVLHDANIAGAQVVIKNIISWFHEHTLLKIKILFLDSGKMLSQYSTLGETLVLSGDDFITEDGMINKIIEFCGGKPDLIYGNTVAVGRIYKLLKQIGSPIISHIHELEMSINRYASGWIDFLCDNSDHFVAASKAVGENLQANHHVKFDSISVVYEGIPSAEKNISTAEKGLLKEKLGIPKDKKVIVGCGIGMPFRKGADLFIEVAQSIQKSAPNETQFLWIGGFEATESDEIFGYWHDYQQKIAHDDNIKFLGFQPAPAEYFQVADIFLLTSREDPFPLVMLEAAQCGLPVICFNQSGGASEFVGNDAGIIVPLEDVQMMAASTLKLLRNDELRLSLGEFAQSKVRESFTIDRIAPKILSVCREVAQKKPGVSIIVPNYNHAKYLPERLDSIVNQTYKDYELIVLDDASTDNSMQVLTQYSNQYDFKVMQNPNNSGSPFLQWVNGVQMAQSELIWIAESDDKCENNFLEALIPAFSDKNVKLAYANSWIINSAGIITGDYLATDYLKDISEGKWNKNYKIRAEEEINDGLGVKNTILNISSAVFQKPNFDDEFRDRLIKMLYVGDWLWYVNLIHSGYIYYEAQKLNYHRRHDESVIGKLLQTKKVDEFYREIATVHKAICQMYEFNPLFLDKWIAYHKKQWYEFFPNESFEKISEIYPYLEVMELIRSKSQIV